MRMTACAKKRIKCWLNVLKFNLIHRRSSNLIKSMYKGFRNWIWPITCSRLILVFYELIHCIIKYHISQKTIWNRLRILQNKILRNKFIPHRPGITYTWVFLTKKRQGRKHPLPPNFLRILKINIP